MSDTNADAIIDAATRAADPSLLDPTKTYGAVVPEGSTFEHLDLEYALPVPRRTIGTVLFVQPDSLCAYVARHGEVTTAPQTELYADLGDDGAPRSPQITAVLNPHRGPEEPGWADHRAILNLEKTDEWKRWKRNDRRMMNQSDFAEHIEDGLVEIVEPPAADMLELAQTFQAQTQVEFRSARRLADGQAQLNYTENIDAKAGQAGQITIPTSFAIAVRPFEGLTPYKVSCRLRYRLVTGHLSIGYILDRPDLVLRSAFDDVVKQVEETTKLTAYHGRPY